MAKLVCVFALPFRLTSVPFSVARPRLGAWPGRDSTVSWGRRRRFLLPQVLPGQRAVIRSLIGPPADQTRARRWHGEIRYWPGLVSILNGFILTRRTSRFTDPVRLTCCCRDDCQGCRQASSVHYRHCLTGQMTIDTGLKTQQTAMHYYIH